MICFSIWYWIQNNLSEVFTCVNPKAEAFSISWTWKRWNQEFEVQWFLISWTLWRGRRNQAALRYCWTSPRKSGSLSLGPLAREAGRGWECPVAAVLTLFTGPFYWDNFMKHSASFTDIFFEELYLFFFYRSLKICYGKQPIEILLV